MSNIKNLKRIQNAFARGNIIVERDQNSYHVRKEHGEARILLPNDFPLEAKAVEQLLHFASVQSPGTDACVCQACATPDFHPGSLAPVGTVVATTPDMVIPQAIGTDINCGMRLLSTNISALQAEQKISFLEKDFTHLFLHGNRDVPLPSSTFRTLFENNPKEIFSSIPKKGIWTEVNFSLLEQEVEKCIGLSEFGGKVKYAPDALLHRDEIRDPALGSVGSGNHFVELQIVDQIYNKQIAYQLGLKEGNISVMIHSGSRDVGFYVGSRWMDQARAEWPKGLAHPKSGLYALTGHLAEEYLHAMGVASRWAWLNRVVLGEMVRKIFRENLQTEELKTIVDVPHNVILQEDGFNIHRKGSTPARQGDLALIPGSMGDYSYLVEGLGNTEWLSSCSHGAGRSIRRQSTRSAKPDTTGLPWRCVTLRESRRIEEAPSSYKPVGPVIDIQEKEGMIKPVVRFKPFMTVKC